MRKKIHKLNNLIDEALFTYEDLFKAFVAGDTEGMRKGDNIDREEFEDWFCGFFGRNKR